MLLDLEVMAADLSELLNRPSVSLIELVGAHISFAEALAASEDMPGPARLWAGEAGEAAAGFISELLDSAASLGDLSGASYGSLFDVLMTGRAVRPRYGGHPRLAIWGLLEARLQHAELIILGGLNEGTWPPEAPSDPWMSRPMRGAFGLPLPERRIGLSAHGSAFKTAAYGTSRIVQHLQTVVFGDGVDGVDIARQADLVDRNNSLRSGG